MSNLQDTIETMAPETTGFSLGDYKPREERTDFEEGVWYRGTIAERLEQPFEMTTREAPVRDPNKTTRNVFIAATVRNKDGRTRNLSGLFNYNPADLNATRKAAVDAAVAEAKTAYAAAKEAYTTANGGSSKGFTRKFSEFLSKDVQTTQFTYRKIGSLVAIAPTFSPTPNGTGGLDVAPLIGVDADFLLETDDKGYLRIAEVAPVGTHKSTRDIK